MAQQAELQVILLAAGLSTRMGQKNKLLLPFDGKPIVRHVAETIIRANIGQLHIVTGFEADKVEQALSGLNLNILHNKNFASGQMSSVKLAYQKLSHHNGDMMIALGDMPQITALEYQKLVAAFETHKKQKIIIPYLGEQRGNPIIMPAKFNDEISDGSMKAGCRQLTQKRPNDVVRLPILSNAYIADIDTPEDYDHVTNAPIIFPICC